MTNVVVECAYQVLCVHYKSSDRVCLLSAYGSIQDEAVANWPKRDFLKNLKTLITATDDYNRFADEPTVTIKSL